MTSTDAPDPDQNPDQPSADRAGTSWWARLRRRPAQEQAVVAAQETSEDGDDIPQTRWQRYRQRRRNRKQRPFWVELPILVVLAFTLTFLIQTFVAKVYYIPSGSMETTLHGDTDGGDRVLVNKVIYKFTDPEPGDVVVFRGPANWTPDVQLSGPTSWFGKAMQALGAVVGVAPPDEKDFVKRVIAVGGQTVMCCDEIGRVTVNGEPLDEPYIYENFPFTPGLQDCTTAQISQRCFGPFTVPADHLWMMGDHRRESADSAYNCRGILNAAPHQCRGPISVDDVIGKASFVVMPVSRWQVIDDPDIQGGNGG